jgi:hypothetical protein
MPPGDGRTTRRSAACRPAVIGEFFPLVGGCPGPHLDSVTGMQALDARGLAVDTASRGCPEADPQVLVLVLVVPDLRGVTFEPAQLQVGVERPRGPSTRAAGGGVRVDGILRSAPVLSSAVDVPEAAGLSSGPVRLTLVGMKPASGPAIGHLQHGHDPPAIGPVVPLPVRWAGSSGCRGARCRRSAGLASMVLAQAWAMGPCARARSCAGQADPVMAGNAKAAGAVDAYYTDGVFGTDVDRDWLMVRWRRAPAECAAQMICSPP